MMLRLIIAGMAGGLVVWTWWPHGDASTDAKHLASTTPAAADDHARPRALGLASCAASACHGNSEHMPPALREGLAVVLPDDCWRSSYLQWSGHDRHASAFDVLKNERSERIMRNWNRSSTKATEDQACLACHANPTIADKADAASRVLQAEGVSCEACHGNAEGWRSAHTGWTKSTDRVYAYGQRGMTKLFDPAIRAATCAGCHIGAPATATTPRREVTHDLIAAGHPRLNFEFTTYLRQLPPHWRERDRENGQPRPPGFEAQFWAIGQSACAEASLRLLKDRTASPRWPELAEFNCYACHHDLKSESGRARAARPGHEFGGLVWGRPGTRLLTDGDSDLPGALDQVERMLDQSLRRPATDLAATIEKALNAAKTTCGRDALTDPDVLLRRWKLNKVDWPYLDWDQAARLYMAAVAIENAVHDRNGHARTPEMNEASSALYRMLRLPREPEHFDSPKDFPYAALRAEFEKWFELLNPR